MVETLLFGGGGGDGGGGSVEAGLCAWRLHGSRTLGRGCRGGGTCPSLSLCPGGCFCSDVALPIAGLFCTSLLLPRATASSSSTVRPSLSLSGGQGTVVILGCVTWLRLGHAGTLVASLLLLLLFAVVVVVWGECVCVSCGLPRPP